MASWRSPHTLRGPRSARRRVGLRAPWAVVGGWALVGAAVTWAADAEATRHGLAGRWEGAAQLPGAAELAVVLDLAPAGDGAWTGSVLLPGRGAPSVPLAALRLARDGSLHVDLTAALGAPPTGQPPAHLTLQPHGAQALRGTLSQAGQRAPVQLQRTGDAQVYRPPPSDALPAGLAGTWRGRYTLGGTAREVTLTLAAPPAAPGEVLVVGKRRTQLPIDTVQAAAHYTAVGASAAGWRLEGRWNAEAGTFDGVVLQGPFEAPVQLRRDAAGGAS